MDKLFLSTLYNGYNYLSMRGLKLIHVSKRGARSIKKRTAKVLNLNRSVPRFRKVKSFKLDYHTKDQ